MALTRSQRAALPRSVFGIPGSRRFPEENPAHAHAALLEAAISHRLGHISDAEYAHIVAKAHRVLSGRA